MKYIDKRGGSQINIIGKNPPTTAEGFLRSLVMKMLILSRKKNCSLPLMRLVYKRNMSELCRFTKNFLKKRKIHFIIL